MTRKPEKFEGPLRNILAIVIVLALLATCVGPSIGPAYGQMSIRDADTIEVDGTPVRLKGLHCPESGTALGDRATTYLRHWAVEAERVECRLTGEKTWDREVGWCSLDGRDIGVTLIEEGLCARCPRYDRPQRYPNTAWPHGLPGYCR